MALYILALCMIYDHDMIGIIYVHVQREQLRKPALWFCSMLQLWLSSPDLELYINLFRSHL